MIKILKSILNFYVSGFKDMSKTSRQLWMIILLKLFIMFVVFRIFFFPNKLKQDFNTDEERSKHVIEQLTKPKRIK